MEATKLDQNLDLGVSKYGEQENNNRNSKF